MKRESSLFRTPTHEIKRADPFNKSTVPLPPYHRTCDNCALSLHILLSVHLPYPTTNPIIIAVCSLTPWIPFSTLLSFRLTSRVFVSKTSIEMVASLHFACSLGTPTGERVCRMERQSHGDKDSPLTLPYLSAHTHTTIRLPTVQHSLQTTVPLSPIKIKKLKSTIGHPQNLILG